MEEELPLIRLKVSKAKEILMGVDFTKVYSLSLHITLLNIRLFLQVTFFLPILRLQTRK